MNKTLLLFAALAFVAAPLFAQKSLTAIGTPNVEDFAGFAGDGFNPNPAPGQLDSDEFAVSGFDEVLTGTGGACGFGEACPDVGDPNNNDFSRGLSTGGVTTGGIWSFDHGGGDTSLGVNPKADDFSPGDITVRYQNNTGSPISKFDVAYEIWYLNNEGSSNSFNFSYSQDNVVYTAVAGLDFVSPEDEDAAPTWQVETRSFLIDCPVMIPDGGFLYLRFTGDAVAGPMNQQDEIALDDLTVTALGAPLPADAQAIDFEGIATGTIVTEVFGNDGFGPIMVEGRNDDCAADLEAAVIFDSSAPTGNDFDLGTPNTDFGGPGIDNDGDPNMGGNAGSPFQNDTEQGNLLIVHEHCDELAAAAASDGIVDDPDDEAGGSVITITFPVPVTVFTYLIIDKETTESLGVEFFDVDGNSIATFTTPATGDNGRGVVATDVGDAGDGTPGVKTIVYDRRGSRGIDDIVFLAPKVGALGDFVWNDVNRDGFQDPGEVGVEGVTVTLTDCDGNFLADMTTGSNGEYLFDNLVEGCYKVTFSDLPPNFVFSPVDNAADDVDSDADPTTGMSDLIDLGPGEIDLTIDAGINLALGEIGDFVWCDNNNDGIQDPGEPGIDGVGVNLSCALPDGSTFIAGTTTDFNGAYLFTDVPAGECLVEVDESTAPADKVRGPNCPPTVSHELLGGESFLDADFCFVNCGECDGGVTSLTLRWDGPATSNIVVEDDNEVIFDDNLDPGDEFTINGSKDDGKFQKNDLEMFVDGNLQIKIHVSCSKTIGPGLKFGDFTVTAGVSRDGGPICPPPCDECDGGVTNLTLQYNGLVGAQIVVEDDDDRYFDGFVEAGAEFSFHGSKDDGKFEKNDLEILVNGSLNTEIHVSCSQPVNPGLDFGDFTVTEAFSRDNGAVCPIDPDACDECKGGVTELTLQYTGATPASVLIQDDDAVYYDAVVGPGEIFTINGTKDDGKFEKNDVDFFVDGDLNAEFHMSCSQPIGPGTQKGSFLVTGAVSKDNGNVCPVPDCLECKGGVTELTLRYTGSNAVQLVVEDDDATYFNDVVEPDEVFTINGTKDDGKFEKNDLEFLVDGSLNAEFHVSCSQPIGPGAASGDFVVEAAVSKDNGNVCPLPDCLECKGGVVELTLQFNGSSSAQIVVADDDMTYFDDTVESGAEFTINGTKDDGKFEKNDVEFFVDGALNAEFHMSCSQPIGPGTTDGLFTVVRAVSKDNGAVCAEPSASVSSASEVLFDVQDTVFDLVPGLPDEYVVVGNFPNPFNPTTTIRFGAPKSGYVRLAVFDILGREIVRLIDDEVSAGWHDAVFTARALPSGTYFLRLSTAETTLSKKMVLMR